jgi:hypothetical protein
MKKRRLLELRVAGVWKSAHRQMLQHVWKPGLPLLGHQQTLQKRRVLGKQHQKQLQPVEAQLQQQQLLEMQRMLVGTQETLWLMMDGVQHQTLIL